jgi:hypothetical protein
VGTGESIEAWADPWIPRGTTRRPRTLNGLDEPIQVADLIDQESGQWDEDLIRFVFVQEDADEILSIPIREHMEDSVAWHFDNKGVFSIKSAYRLGVSLRDSKQDRDASSSSSTDAVSSLWKNIWSLKLPSKVKIFTWRLCHNSLPTRMNIKRKRVELDTVCPMCNRADEDGGHLFLKCKKVKPLWRCLLLEDIRLLLQSAPNPMVMMDMLCALPKDKQTLTIILMWDWWSTRNKLNAEDQERSLEEVCHIIQKHVLEFYHVSAESNGMNSSTSPTSSVEHVAWSRPPTNCVKINFDASFLENSKIGAWGFVARADTGDFIAAAAGKLKHVRHALQAETEACVAAVEGAAALGLHRIVFESGNQTLVKALKTSSFDRYWYPAT